MSQLPKVYWEELSETGATTLLAPKSLFILLCSILVAEDFKVLLNSGLSNCFIDSKFATTYNLPFWNIDLLPLTLINSTINQNVT